MTTPYRPLIRSQADLEQVWLHLLRPLGFGAPSLWLLLIGPDDRLTSVITEITELPPTMDAEMGERLAELLSQLLREHPPGCRWAFLRSRPGTGGVDDADRTWAAALYAMCRDHDISNDVVHLATDDSVRPIPLDDVSGYLRAS